MPEQPTKQKMEADPHAYSLVEKSLDLEFTGKETRYPIGINGEEITVMVYIDKETRERFYKIDSYRASSKKLLALILKGVVNVSDVVKVGEEYFSHEQDFNLIERHPENIMAEMEANIFILGKVFENVGDHRYYPAGHPKRVHTEEQHPSLSPQVEHSNLIIDKENGRLSFFDFDSKWLDHILTEHMLYRFAGGDIFSQLQAMFRRELADSSFSLNSDKNRTLNLLREKVNILLGLYSDNGFERFEKEIQKSELKINEENQRVLFDAIVLRLQALDEALSEIK